MVIFNGWTVSTHVPYINHKTITVPQIKVGCSKMVLEHNNKVQQTTNKKSVFSSPKENQLQQKINRCIVILCKKKKYAFIKFPHLIQHQSLATWTDYISNFVSICWSNLLCTNNALHVFFDSFTWTFQNILFLKYGVHKILCEGIFFTDKHYKHWIIRRFTCSRDSKQVPHFNTTHQYFPSLNFEFVSCFIIGSLHTKKLVQ